MDDYEKEAKREAIRQAIDVAIWSVGQVRVAELEGKKGGEAIVATTALYELARLVRELGEGGHD